MQNSKMPKPIILLIIAFTAYGIILAGGNYAFFEFAPQQWKPKVAQDIPDPYGFIWIMGGGLLFGIGLAFFAANAPNIYRHPSEFARIAGRTVVFFLSILVGICLFGYSLYFLIGR